MKKGNINWERAVSLIENFFKKKKDMLSKLLK